MCLRVDVFLQLPGLADARVHEPDERLSAGRNNRQLGLGPRGQGRRQIVRRRPAPAEPRELRWRRRGRRWRKRFRCCNDGHFRYRRRKRRRRGWRKHDRPGVVQQRARFHLLRRRPTEERRPPAVPRPDVRPRQGYTVVVRVRPSRSALLLLEHGRLPGVPLQLLGDHLSVRVQRDQP